MRICRSLVSTPIIPSYYFILATFSVLSGWSDFRADHKYGNSHNFGDFQACKNMDANKLSTQYCMVQYFSNSSSIISVPPKKSIYQNIWTDLNISFLGAICIPSSCTIEDVRNILKLSFGEGNLTFGDKIHCKWKINEKPKGLFEIFAISNFNFLNFYRIL